MRSFYFLIELCLGKPVEKLQMLAFFPFSPDLHTNKELCLCLCHPNFFNTNFVVDVYYVTSAI